MHPSTYEYHQPTDRQIEQMVELRAAAKAYQSIVDRLVPEGPDKTYTTRKFREVAMWANVAVTRLPDGTPRY